MAAKSKTPKTPSAKTKAGSTKPVVRAHASVSGTGQPHEPLVLPAEPSENRKKQVHARDEEAVETDYDATESSEAEETGEDSSGAADAADEPSESEIEQSRLPALRETTEIQESEISAVSPSD